MKSNLMAAAFSLVSGLDGKVSDHACCSGGSHFFSLTVPVSDDPGPSLSPYSGPISYNVQVVLRVQDFCSRCAGWVLLFHVGYSCLRHVSVCCNGLGMDFRVGSSIWRTQDLVFFL